MDLREPVDTKGGKEAIPMSISPHIAIFVLFMLAVFGATRIDEVRQRHRAVQRGPQRH